MSEPTIKIKIEMPRPVIITSQSATIGSQMEIKILIDGASKE